ncbi:hypothetical protein J8F10_03210 [Gemmata sp. G18]|uniref:DUF1573 domain-containing protein n=1 Tax=Gemmata palustris TaxID=2822762 RepID=A0ABS5BKS4_9BACT|nr:hypothetical protein [Gemmata palustris]MBP3954304.1 hypothetical protein [Gemmata palustris]
MSPDWKTNKAASTTIKISNLSSETVAMLIEESAKNIEAAFDRSQLPPGGTCNLTLTAGPKWASNAREVIKIRTTHIRESLIELPIDILPLDPLKIEPPSIRFGVASRKEVQSRRLPPLTISGNRADSIEVSKIEFPDFLTVSEFKRINDGILSATIECHGPIKGLTVDGSITLHLSTKGGAPIVHTIPITGLLRGEP